MLKTPSEKKKIGKNSKIKGSVPAFLLKTYEILEDNKCSDIISWNKDGTAFIVKKVNEFSEEILPKYFKHNNFASFVRQLNMYDFHKTRKQNNGNEFRHALFRRSEKHLLGEIKRKATTIVSSPSYESDDISVVKKKKKLAPISTYTFRKNVESLEEKFKQMAKIQKKTELKVESLESENKQLWRTNRRLMINIMAKKKQEIEVQNRILGLIGEVIDEAEENNQLPQDFGRLSSKPVGDDEEEKFDEATRREHSDTTMKHHPREDIERSVLSESDWSLSSATKKVGDQQGLKALLSKLLMKMLKKSLKRNRSQADLGDKENCEFEQPSTEKKAKLESDVHACQKIEADYPNEQFFSFAETYVKPHNKLFFQEPVMMDFKFDPLSPREDFGAPRESEVLPAFQNYQSASFPLQENVDVSHLFNLYIRNDY